MTARRFRLFGLSLLCSALLIGATPPAEKGVVKGRVVTSAGQPLSGAEVVADNRQFYNSNVVTLTDAKGLYRSDVRRPAGTWHATAQIKRKLNGQSFTFDLHPDSDADFAGTDGAVRNFTWKLRGERPDGGRYGSPVIVYASLDNPYYIDTANVELTLKPVGPLPDGDAVADVPVARYEISARYLDPAEGAKPLVVRKRYEEQYTPSTVADFKVTMPTVQNIEVEVKSP